MTSYFLFEKIKNPTKITAPTIKSHFTTVNVQSATVCAASFAPNNKIFL